MSKEHPVPTVNPNGKHGDRPKPVINSPNEERYNPFKDGRTPTGVSERSGK